MKTLILHLPHIVVALGVVAMLPFLFMASRRSPRKLK